MSQSSNGELERAVGLVKAKDTPISLKMRCLFYLRNLGTAEAASCIQRCLSRDSVLLDHEVAYVLGQLKQRNSIEYLFEMAGDSTLSDIVRHEAIEALGNFEDPTLIPRIENFLNIENLIIKESAILALQKLAENEPIHVGRFGSRDPAYPYRGEYETAVYMFERGNIAEKYKAIFYLRDKNDKESVDTLASGFKDPSDLLRHEIAFVFGQMQNEHAIPALIKVLEDPEEKDIVRHEAAEALGNIGTMECVEVLKGYLDSDIRILKESAQVGLGIADHADKYLDITWC